MVKKAKIAQPVGTSSATNYTAFIGKDRAESLFLDVVERAENGDMDAFKIVADRLFPKAKAGNFFRFNLPVDATPAEQIEYILQAVAKAQIDIDSASTLISSLTKYLDVQKSNHEFTHKLNQEKKFEELKDKYGGDSLQATLAMDLCD